ncbi:MAG: PTS transporter subunit IIC, partial [Brevinema sp.]
MWQMILEYIINIFRQPILFLCFIVAMGQIIQKKQISDIIQSILKTGIGIVILFQGVDILIMAMAPLNEIMTTFFPSHDLSVNHSQKLGDFSSFLSNYSFEIGLTLFLSSTLNIIIARFTSWKAVFLTMNIAFWIAMVCIALGVQMNLNTHTRIIAATIATTLYLVVPSNLLRPFVKELSGSDSFTIGHTTSIFCFIAILIGTFIGDKKNSAETITLPKSLAFMSDANIMSGLIIAITYLLLLLFNILKDHSFSPSFLTEHGIVAYSFLQGVKFSAGTTILLLGSRMILVEIVPSFKGISDFFVPNAIPALDIPMIFSFGPNSLMLGFLIAMISSLLTLILLG